jgi:hypothetical protein
MPEDPPMGQRQNQDGESSSGENTGPDGAKALSATGEGAASAGAGPAGEDNDLPNVESPKLGETTEHAAEQRDSANRRPLGALPALLSERTRETASEPATASSAQPRSFRFALLAAAIACAAGIGALAGSLSASGIGSRSVAEAPHARTADARDVLQALKAQMTELSSLKASIDAASRSSGAQFARITDRLGSLERAQADPQAKLLHIAEAVDRLDKRPAAAPETTGSIAAAPPAPAAAPEASPPILRNWEVEEVHGRRALVASRYGSEFLVSSGSSLPGLGHVQEIKRQNGEWLVITEKGIIHSGR